MKKQINIPFKTIIIIILSLIILLGCSRYDVIDLFIPKEVNEDTNSDESFWRLPDSNEVLFREIVYPSV